MTDNTHGKTQLKGVVLLLLTALIWGAAFVAQSVAMDNIGAFTFNAIRMLMGAVVLLPFIIVRDRLSARKSTVAQLAEKKRLGRKSLVCGAVLGVFFCIASNFQQFAFYYSSPGKIAFITALYIFFVPLIGLFFKKRVSALTWLCISFGFVGLYFLCIDPANFGVINLGDVLSFICAIFFSFQILLIERFVAYTDPLKLSVAQFAVAGVLASVLMFVFERPDISAIMNAAVPLLYAGIMSCGLAYTFQILGQKYTESTIASLLMCMESVFAVLAAALLLHETLSGREILGCAIMFAAIILSQLTELIAARVREKKARAQVRIDDMD